MKFHFKADIYFEAEDLEDACRKLAEHFLAIEDEESGYEMIDFEKGEIELAKVAEST